MVGTQGIDHQIRSAGRNVHTKASEARQSTFLGMRHAVLLSSAQSDGVAGVVEITIPPGAGAVPHTNTREALTWYVIDGVLNVFTEDGSVEVSSGSSIFLPKGNTHGFLNASTDPVRALLVCSPGGFEGFLLDLGARLPSDLPSGPPSKEVVETLIRVGAQYGVAINPNSGAGTTK